MAEILVRGGETTREGFQSYGAGLEMATSGRWLADRCANCISRRINQLGYVIDSVRTVLQVNELRRAFSFSNDVVHLHLTASPSVLRERFACRATGSIEEPGSYGEAVSHRIEEAVESLSGIADIRIDTSELTPEEVFAQSRGLYD